VTLCEPIAFCISPFPPFLESSTKTVLNQSSKNPIFPVKETKVRIKEPNTGVKEIFALRFKFGRLYGL
jgi:hypothetical protein